MTKNFEPRIWLYFLMFLLLVPATVSVSDLNPLSLQLLEHTDFCSNNCYSVYEVTAGTNTLFDEDNLWFEFQNSKEQVLKHAQYVDGLNDWNVYINTTGWIDTEVITDKEVCHTENSTKVCDIIQQKSIEKQWREYYIPFEPRYINSGESFKIKVTGSLAVDISKTEQPKVDNVFVFYDEVQEEYTKFTQWAYWNGSTGLLLAMDLDSSNWLDKSGNQNGTAVNTPTSISAGKINNATHFVEGDTDAINLGDTIYDGLTTMTTALWVKRSGNSTYRSIIEKGSEGGKIPFRLSTEGAGTEVMFGSYTAANDCRYDTGYVLNHDKWEFLIVTYNNGNWSLYKNNSLVHPIHSTVCGDTTIPSNAAFTGIGSRHETGTWAGGFGGTIDSVQVYNRVLNVTERQFLYNNSFGCQFGAEAGDFSNAFAGCNGTGSSPPTPPPATGNITLTGGNFVPTIIYYNNTINFSNITYSNTINTTANVSCYWKKNGLIQDTYNSSILDIANGTTFACPTLVSETLSVGDSWMAYAYVTSGVDNRTLNKSISVSQTYSLGVVNYTNFIGETINTSFKLNLSTISGHIQGINATLIYNGSTLLPSFTLVSGVYTFDASTITPLININNSPVSFYWNITIDFVNDTYQGVGINYTNTSVYYQNLTYSYKISNVAGNKTIIESQNANISVTTLNNSGYATQQVILDWNGTNFSMTKLNNNLWNQIIGTGNVTGNKTINITAYYNLTYGEVSIYRNSSLYTQIIRQLLLDDCTAGKTVLINYTFWKELSKNDSVSVTFGIYASLYPYNGNSNVRKIYNTTKTSITSFGLCVNEPATFVVDLDTTWGASGYDSREYHVENGLLSNQTTNLSFYLLSTTNSTAITIIIADQNDVELQDVYVYAYQYNIINKTEILLGSEISDVNGKSVFNLDVSDKYYIFKFYQNGVLRLVSDPQKLAETSYTFRIVNVGATSFTTFRDLITTTTRSLTFNDASNTVSFVYNDVGNLTSQVCMGTWFLNNSNATLLNTVCSNSQSDTLTYTVPYIEEASYRSIAYCTAKSDGKSYPFSTLDFSKGLLIPLGLEGVLFGTMILLVLACVGFFIVRKVSVAFLLLGVGCWVITAMGWFGILIGPLMGVIFVLVAVGVMVRD